MVKCLFLPHRNDNNAWLGETKDREIGYFKSEHLEEVLDENFDGRYKNVIRCLCFLDVSSYTILCKRCD